ncbi:hypothetical protein LUZ60_014013 [Juncus effusus]|nr:hypothetical protein LUZ60_014013 [Juncus effusus]
MSQSHWCYQCRQRVRPHRNRHTVCPFCDSGFIVELQDFDSFPSFNFHPDPRHVSIMEAIHSMMHQGGMIGISNAQNPRHVSSLFSDSDSGPWLLFRGQLPRHVADSHWSAGDYFVGPGLDDLIEQLSSQTDSSRRGPPPASRDAIDSLHVVRIEQRHLNGELNCAVCKERFVIGTEGREMPCEHVYHEECIVPWLEQHNSCPVCRYELPAQGSGSSGSCSRERSGSLGSRNNSGRTRRRNLLSFLWPFRSSNSNSSSSSSSSSSR